MIERLRAGNGTAREIGYGTADGKPILLTDPARKGHMHILGAPDQGKSMFLYSQICADIQDGYGACLLDPNGGTAKNVLKYAVAKNFKKIIYINPKDFRKFDRWPTINPLTPKAPTEAVLATFMDSVRNIWNDSSGRTGNINKYLSAVIYLLHRGKYSLHEARYFLSRLRYKPWADKILRSAGELNENRIFIEEAFSDKFLFGNFQSTINRLNPFFQGSLRNMFSSTECPISFQKLIEEKYIILVTMDASEIGEVSQQLLGTVIINYLMRAKERREGDSTPYYLYIDEVGQFATGKLAHILDYKRHIGMRMIMAHQRFDQLGDYQSAIKSAQTKILFYTAEDQDRLKSVKMMFGGEISDRDASHYAGTLKKQQAIFKAGKQDAVTVRFHDASVPDIPPIEIARFKESYIYNTNINPFFRSSEQIKKERTNRFVVPTNSGATPQRPSRPKQNPSAARPAPAEHKPKAATGTKDDTQPVHRPDTSSSPGSSVFDNIADSADVLQQEKGRKRAKRNAPPAEAG